MRLPGYDEIYARTHGYFWLPCPICGKFFGGHQCSNNTRTVPCKKAGDGTGHMTCPDHDYADGEWQSIDLDRKPDPDADCNGCHGHQIGVQLGYIRG